MAPKGPPIKDLLNKLNEHELSQLDEMLKNIADVSSSPITQSRLSEWVEFKANQYGIDKNITPRRKRSLSL